MFSNCLMEFFNQYKYVRSDWQFFVWIWGKKHAFWHWEWGQISALKSSDREPCPFMLNYLVTGVYHLSRLSANKQLERSSSILLAELESLLQ